MKIDRVIVGLLNTNCYILSIGKYCIVIDPGDEYDKIKPFLSNKEVIAIIITHYHFDHIGALEYFDSNKVLDIRNLEEKNYNIGPFYFNVIYTLGHKEDCITIYFEKEKIMFTGDFIFKNSIGRTDLAGGNDNDMINSINKIKKYDADIVIYPGHGDKTILGDELINLDSKIE